MKATLQLSQLLDTELTEHTYKLIDALVATLSQEVQAGEVSPEEIHAILLKGGEAYLEHSLQGYALRKPYGYAGDFLMIDRIYTHYESSLPELAPWDRYFHAQAAPRAVRNRKAYFKASLLSRTPQQPTLDLLNLASGPGRDLLELYEALPPDYVLRTTCVDLDAHAVAYAEALTKAYAEHITFIQKNILRYADCQKYDVIWSAGLFDYFNDKVFVRLLKRFKEWLKPGGEIIIGNFNQDHNPSRAYMEIFGAWYLEHRTASHLKALAETAGYQAAEIRVGRESEGVNLFLHLSPEQAFSQKDMHVPLS